MEIFASIPKTEQATYESKLNLVSLISTRDLAISRLNTEMALLDKEVIDSSISLVTLKDSLSNTKDDLSILVNNNSTQFYQINLNLDSSSNDQPIALNTVNRTDIIKKINLNIFKLNRETLAVFQENLIAVNLAQNQLDASDGLENFNFATIVSDAKLGFKGEVLGDISKVIFSLAQEKSRLEYELMLLDIQSKDNTSSSLVGNINTTEIYSKSMIIILLGLIFGLAISVIMVFLSLTFNNIFRSNKA